MPSLTFGNLCDTTLNSNLWSFRCQTELKNDTYKILGFHCSKFLFEIILHRGTAFDSRYPVTGSLYVSFIFFIGIRLELCEFSLYMNSIMFFSDAA